MPVDGSPFSPSGNMHQQYILIGKCDGSPESQKDTHIHTSH